MSIQPLAVKKLFGYAAVIDAIVIAFKLISDSDEHRVR